MGQGRNKEIDVQMKVSQLRVLQIVCLVVALSACWLVAHLGKPNNNGEIGPIQWLVVVAAIYSAVSGVTLQRKITKGPIQPRTRNGLDPV